MSVRFEDYYEVLGVPRTATAAEIQAAYRRLARKHHPDVDKTAGATERFKKISEANEVLKNPETRARYDALGANWKTGQEFSPPPGWAPFEFDAESFRRAHRGRRAAPEPEMEGFSDFFEALFGGRGAFAHDEEGESAAPRTRRRARAPDASAAIRIPPALAILGGPHGIGLREESGAERHLEVRIPAGTAHGTTLRLRGQGGGGASDLLLNIEIAPPPGWRIDGDDLFAPLRIAPFEAVLGARVALQLPEGGEAQVTIPPGSSSGRRLRLRGRGLPKKGGGRGDLMADIAIVVPDHVDDAERALYEDLKRRAKFDPRA